jgi:hypothetical protein
VELYMQIYHRRTKHFCIIICCKLNYNTNTTKERNLKFILDKFNAIRIYLLVKFVSYTEVDH